ncbi:putative transcriptional regulatory protein [Mycobacterium tuberculosis H37Rv] [Mycolicibacterium parafortuitum]|uniref:Putative transcriptional regulatory protein [Mycobacterium tuberculosis H37Rv] n=1 Tax=Mycolicibacterium parafortuitum TaxID=39692 RepID=A0A375YDG3_MYCPF|nr:putative transcriptional regulatory protein [Mycobacterium tuberculosis H37Rv] [Mycolicibacterium parafortuitum]
MVLAHAADLFAERGPAATSLRDIAARSNINQGLIFRHIGNKEAVVAAVLEYLADDLAEAQRSGAPRDEILARAQRSWTVIARTQWDGYDVGRLQQRFPNIETLIATAGRYTDDEPTARLATADALAMQLGWHVFGPFLRIAAGIPDDVPRPVPDITDTIRRLTS